VLLIALAIAAGMVRGNLTLLQATAVPDRWGATHYGLLSGLPGRTSAHLSTATVTESARSSKLTR
jgi:hypothetical protein